VDRAEEITRTGDALRGVLDAKHQAREVTLRASRETIQCAAASIRASQRGEYARAEELADDAAEALARADAAVASHLDVRHGGYLHDAKKEYAEARITLAFVRGDPLPAPDALKVEAPAYLNGLAEAASELRRHILDCMRVDQLERAEMLLATMDEVYGLLVTVDYPDAVTGGLRRTTDALRAVIERTRGDFTNALVAARLRAAVEGTGGAASA
jgi:translin